MWYYALAHKPSKVREVMNLLISYSLLQSTPYPPTPDLDDHLRRLLADRNRTLRGFAAQDLEAAELLGKMLSGYASLRQFYELRDNESSSPEQRRRQAVAALTGVIASADDNIRGGLFDASRDAIVSEDFLLALLGEASVFVSGPDHAFNGGSGEEAEVDLDQIDVLLKAVEDLQSVGDDNRVYRSAEEFFQLVLASVPGGPKGSTPADLMMRKSTTAAGGTGGSFVLAGSQMLAGKLQRSISGGGGGVKRDVRRGWDWRREVKAGTTGEEFLRRLRVGLTKDLARLWLEEADGGMWS